MHNVSSSVHALLQVSLLLQPEMLDMKLSCHRQISSQCCIALHYPDLLMHTSSLIWPTSGCLSNYNQCRGAAQNHVANVQATAEGQLLLICSKLKWLELRFLSCPMQIMWATSSLTRSSSTSCRFAVCHCLLCISFDIRLSLVDLKSSAAGAAQMS